MQTPISDALNEGAQKAGMSLHEWLRYVMNVVEITPELTGDRDAEILQGVERRLADGAP